MSGNKIVIAMPCYSGEPQMPVMSFLFAEIIRISTTLHREVGVDYRIGNGLVDKVRNSIVSDFLADPDNADLIMMDDDNYPDPFGLVKLLQAPADMVALPCRSRCDDLHWPVRWLLDQPIQRDDNTRLIEVQSAGTGIIRFSRACLEKLTEAFADDWYHDHECKTGKATWLFRLGPTNGGHTYWGEDVILCRKWRELGGKVHIQPDIVTHHIGKKQYTHSMTDWLMACVPALHVSDNGGHDPAVVLANDLSVHRIKDKSVVYVLASRGRPEECFKAITETVSHRCMPTTKVVVGLDDDDTNLAQYKDLLGSFPPEFNVSYSIGPRPDTVGEVYNRCVGEVAADLYVNSADDVQIVTDNWDAKLLKESERFPEGIGVIGFGNMPVPSMLPALMATSRPLIDRMGYFLQTSTPFWWMDTWLFEIGAMIGRMIRLDSINVGMTNWQRTRGMRDLEYWAKFFDDMRPERRELAERIIRADDFNVVPAVKKLLLGKLDHLCAEFEKSNAVLRNPDHAAGILANHAHDAPADARYDRIMARSMRHREKLTAA